MDRTDSAAAPAAALPPASAASGGWLAAGSQSRIPAAIFLVLGAAILFRVATGILARSPSEGLSLIHI